MTGGTARKRGIHFLNEADCPFVHPVRSRFEPVLKIIVGLFQDTDESEVRLELARVFMTHKQMAVVKNPANITVRPHQTGGAVFTAILSEDVDRKPFPTLPPSARLAVLVGQPSEPGPYLIRVKVPHGVRLMPHRHLEDRIYTVISGVFYVGRGEEFEPDKLEAYPPGAVIVLPGNTSHFHWAKSGEYVTQVTAIAPLGLEYVNSRDDPRNQSSSV
jgi:quercetin dioxygenase-like cupin family protein